MASKQPFQWPSIGRKDADRHIYADILLKATRLLKAACQGTSTPSGTAQPFLESIIAYFTNPAVANDGQDALWKAIQQMQQDHRIIKKNPSPGSHISYPLSTLALHIPVTLSLTVELPYGWWQGNPDVTLFAYPIAAEIRHVVSRFSHLLYVYIEELAPTSASRPTILAIATLCTFGLPCSYPVTTLYTLTLP